jgi:hypothetical protein
VKTWKSSPTDEVNMTKSVICMASSAEHADSILCELMNFDFANEDISILFPDRMGVRDFAHAPSTRASEGACIGAGFVGALGAVIGFALGAGVATFPSLASFLAAGPIMAALGGSGLGAASGGIAGALLGLRIAKVEAHPYRGRLERGRLVISVHVENELERERACWICEKEGAEAVATVAELPVA